MKITDVEAIILRQPDVDDSKADGSQDALLVRVQAGGHVGFLSGSAPGHLHWLPRRLLHFFRAAPP